MRTDGNDLKNHEENGLTKREYFAALAMQAILSDPKDMESEEEANEGEQMEDEEGGEMEGEEMEGNKRRFYGRREGESCMECCCRIAVEHADELIRALNK
ncbi:MAG: hypothetical protein ACO3IN_04560 [Steroidobacteraceae bacterium]